MQAGTKGAVEKIDPLDKLIHDAAQPVRRAYSIRVRKAGSK